MLACLLVCVFRYFFILLHFVIFATSSTLFTAFNERSTWKKRRLAEGGGGGYHRSFFPLWWRPCEQSLWKTSFLLWLAMQSILMPHIFTHFLTTLKRNKCLSSIPRYLGVPSFSSIPSYLPFQPLSPSLYQSERVCLCVCVCLAAIVGIFCGAQSEHSGGDL